MAGVGRERQATNVKSLGMLQDIEVVADTSKLLNDYRNHGS
jgi:hypothetical protein